MALRQWMVPHEWMIKYTPQTEWIKGRGILVWVAEVFGSIGAGLYLASMLYNSLLGMSLAWLTIVFLKMLPHLLYLGRPSRFWRAIPLFTGAWRTSWITRGLFFTTLFIGFALMHLILAYFFPGTVWETVLKTLSGITAFLVGIYSGFVMNYCRSVPFWNTALLPPLLFFASLADGFALIIAIGLFDNQVEITSAEAVSRILLTINVVIMTIFLWNATHTSKTAKFSTMLLLKGGLAMPFWVGVVAFGIIIPLAVSISGYLASEPSLHLLIAAIALHTIGTAALKYCLLKAGLHNPILTATKKKYHDTGLYRY